MAEGSVAQYNLRIFWTPQKGEGTLAEAPKAPRIEAPSRDQRRIQKARLGATVGWEKGFEAETPKTYKFEAPSRDAEGDEGVVNGNGEEVYPSPAD